jgi:hypothetical protein
MTDATSRTLPLPVIQSPGKRGTGEVSVLKPVSPDYTTYPTAAVHLNPLSFSSPRARP